uniref:Uncharacterized protein n=1 Tax=Anguilla anguilla TaxID=7936 RepID=A0A0E9TIJ3_ANGAN
MCLSLHATKACLPTVVIECAARSLQVI